MPGVVVALSPGRAHLRLGGAIRSVDEIADRAGDGGEEAAPAGAGEGCRGDENLRVGGDGCVIAAIGGDGGGAGRSDVTEVAGRSAGGKESATRDDVRRG